MYPCRNQHSSLRPWTVVLFVSKNASQSSRHQITGESFGRVDVVEPKDRSILNVFQPTVRPCFSPRSARNNSQDTSHQRSRPANPQWLSLWWPSDHPAEYPHGSRSAPAHSRNSLELTLSTPSCFLLFQMEPDLKGEGGLAYKNRNFLVAARGKLEEGSYQDLFHLQL